MPELSRRSFVQLVTGTLASLPALAGGLILAPRPAYADTEQDEADRRQLAGLESEWVVIDVVEPWEAGFMVVDVTKGEQLDGGLVRYPPVQGAKVTVTSLFNNKVAEGTTNENGVANIDVRQLSVAKSGEDVNKLSSYQFYGSVAVERDGYRMFKTAKLVVEGGTGLQVPAHPLDTDEHTPYPYLVSFDEWDALYCKNDFPITPANKDEHTIVAQMLGVPTDSGVTMELWVEGEKAPRQSAQATTGESVVIAVKHERVITGQTKVKRIVDYDFMTGEPVYAEFDEPVYEDRRTEVHGRPATATFKAPFLKEGDAACLPVSAKLRLVVAQGSGRWTVPLAVTTSKGVVDEPTGKEGQRLSPINTSQSSGSGLDVRWPGGIPMMGGGNLKFWTPELPVNIYVNPFGLVQVTIKTPSWGYSSNTDEQSKGEESNRSKWGTYPRKSVKDQWDKKVNTLKAMSKKASETMSKSGKVQQLDLFRSFSVTANFQLLALAKWDTDQGLFQGEVAGQLVIALNFTLSENFFAGPIPVLITFALDASLTFGLSAAAYSAKKNKNEALLDAVFDFSRWKWDYANTGFTMTLNVTPSLSVGVGIRGVASISVKGTITLTLFLGVPMGTQPKGLPNPHFTAGWSAQVLLVLELFLFTRSFALFNKKFSNFYDNWDGKDKGIKAQAEEEAQSALSALADKSLEELLADLQPITDAMLTQTSEAAIAAQGLSAQAEGEAFDWNSVRTESVVEMDDGTPLTYFTYDLSGRDAARETIPDEGTAPQAEGGAPQGEGDAPQGEGEVAPKEQASAADGTGAAEDGSAQAGVIAAMTDAEEAGGADNAVEPAGGDLAAESQGEEDAAQAQAQDASDEDFPSQTVQWLQAMADAPLPSPGVVKLGVAGGIRPSSDFRVFGSDDAHVFSFAKAKTVNLPSDAGTWCFRIAAVSVGGSMRTRVVGNCIAGSLKGASWIVEFDTSKAGIGHDDLYDYDFDVATLSREFKQDPYIVLGPSPMSDADEEGLVAQAGTEHRVTFAIVSGKRDGGGAGLASVATDLVFTCISFAYGSSGDLANRLRDSRRPAVEYSFSRAGREVLGEDGRYHSLSSIQIKALSGWTKTYGQLYVHLVSFLDRRAQTPEGTLGADATPRVGLLLSYEGVSMGAKDGFAIDVVDSDALSDAVGQLSDTTVYEQELALYDSSDEGASASLMLRGSRVAHYILMRFRFDYRVDKEGNNDAALRIASVRRCQDYSPAIRLVACPAQGYFLTSYPEDPAQLALPADQQDHSKWSLHKVTWSDDATPQMLAEPIGPAGFNVVNFAVNPRGTFLFWPHTRDADEDRVWDADGTEDVQERPAVHQVMACCIRGNHFSDPFVVADLPTDTDMLSVMDLDLSTVMEALRTEYVDTGERGKNGQPLYHAANIWYTSVPAVRCVTATACEAPSPFVSPGGQIDFRVAVRNDGNTFLSGCTLELAARNDATGAYELVPGASAQVTFGKDTIQESTYNPSDGNGGLKGVEDDYALPPGKTSVYAVTVTVPKDWGSGERKVLFVASEGVVAAGGGIGAQAEDEQAALDAGAMEFHVEPGEYRVVQVRSQAGQDPDQRHMETLVVDPDGAGGRLFQPAPMETQDGAPATPTTPTTPTAPTTPTRRDELPRTGDEGAGGVAGPLGAGLAALGAAVYAYERRRAENEGRNS